MGKSCKVVVCGQASVGKTSILEQLLYGNHVVGESAGDGEGAWRGLGCAAGCQTAPCCRWAGPGPLGQGRIRRPP